MAKVKNPKDTSNLREIRMFQRLPIEALADMLKLSVKDYDKLESKKFSELTSKEKEDLTTWLFVEEKELDETWKPSLLARLISYRKRKRVINSYGHY